MKIPLPIQKLSEAFVKLPGIGPKSAQRLSYYLLHVPQIQLDEFSDALKRLKKDTLLCSVCRNISDTDPCPICTDTSRETGKLMVVEQPLDIIAFERTGKYKGLYHVLHGNINPLENIGPDELYIEDLFKRLRNGVAGNIAEVIIATNPTMEGDATALYINRIIKKESSRLTVSRLGLGIPTGADLEYADEQTLFQAIEGRRLM